MNKLIVFLLLVIQLTSHAQAVTENSKYVPETDPLVLAKLEKWQDLKFGLMMHWGTYSQWGIVESWSLCPEEYEWCKRTAGSNPDNYYEYKKEYEGLIKTFNPVKFEPIRWAEAAKNAGMKYVVFTTKHHDGFCMYDTEYTDYKITSPECPFSTNPKSDVTREIFDAFRAEDIWAGVYFSKPDWHSPYYWDPKYPPQDRNVNYDPASSPETWNKFVEFTHNQMMELMTNYGQIDLLWIDGGWANTNPKEYMVNFYAEKVNSSESGYVKHRVVNQPMRMNEFFEKAREKQPGLIVVDRGNQGKNQNYLTPENTVPEEALPYPWESCIISGEGWSHTEDSKYISGREGIQMLVDIVAKGGNLLLNVAPTPEGEWQQGAYELLNEYGKWLDINSEGIYSSKVLKPHIDGNIRMTQQDNGNAYFFYFADEGENTMPAEILINSHQPKAGSKVYLLGYDDPLEWNKLEGGMKVLIPHALQKKPPCNYVWTLKVESLDK